MREKRERKRQGDMKSEECERDRERVGEAKRLTETDTCERARQKVRETDLRSS